MTKIGNYKSNTEDRLSKQLDKDKDIAFTKSEMAEYLISLCNLEEDDYVMEPCRGSCSFYNILLSKERGINPLWCEINEGKDFLEYNGINPDITLSNPPFVPRKLFWKFHQKAMEITKREIYGLINMSSMNVFTANRLEEMKLKGGYIGKIHIVSDKRGFGRYCWVQFTKVPNDNGSYTKKIF